MSVAEYLTETGNGPFASWMVPDLIPPSGRGAELVFVFESPHRTELRSQTPVAGDSGRNALRYLLSDHKLSDTLGHWVQCRHAIGDYRVAILNVSSVPLQRSAFSGVSVPSLSDPEWALVSRVRRSRSTGPSAMRDTESRQLSLDLLQHLHDRVAAMSIGSRTCVVAAGKFAARFVDNLPHAHGGVALKVPHPSFNQWNQARYASVPDLVDTRARFTLCM